jgi:hypothetical protein
MNRGVKRKSRIFNSLNMILVALAVVELLFLVDQGALTGQPVRVGNELDQMNKIIQNSQNTYFLELDIPNYLDQSLSHPQKFFSGRKIRIVQLDGIKDYPQNVKLSKRDKISKSLIFEKNLEITKKRNKFFVIEVPKDTSSGYYTLDFEVNKEAFAVPIEINNEYENGIQNTILSTSLSSNILRLGCGYCYWESVLVTNPRNPNYGYFVGGGASDFFVTTKDSWNTSNFDYDQGIDFLTNPPKLSFRGDPKLTFNSDGKLVIASLLYNPSNFSEPITGGFFLNLNNYTENISFNQTILLPIPQNLFNGTWLIFDYEKISSDNSPVSPFFGNMYVFANAVQLGDGWVGQGVFVVSPNGSISERYRSPENEGNYWAAVTSTVVGIDGTVYIAYPVNQANKIAKSTNGALNFTEMNITPEDLEEDCSARVSNESNRSWYIYRGPEIAIDKNGILYAVWAKPKECRPDPDFEYATYAYDFDVYFSSSLDGGVSWMSPIKINNDNSGGDQGFPSIKVDENNDVYVAFLDHRDNQNLAQFDVYLARFNKLNNNFQSNIKINDISVPNPYGYREPGDYLDMVGFGNNQIFISHPCVNPNFQPNPWGDVSNDACVAKVSTNYSICSDSDDGKDYSDKGTLIVTNFSGTFTYTDVCTTSNNLKEHYCNNNQANYIYHYCAYGCSYGKCNPAPRKPSCYIDPRTKKKICNVY